MHSNIQLTSPVRNQPPFIRQLNELLTRYYDSAKGYKEAAEKVDNEGFTRIFSDLAITRKRFTEELISEIQALGGFPDTGTSLEGDLHRQWIRLKDLFVNGDESQILEECLRGESYLIKTIDKILQEEWLSKRLYQRIHQQQQSVHSDLRRLNTLQETMNMSA